MPERKKKKARIVEKFDLEEVYLKCQSNTSLNHLDESGIIELELWPIFLQHERANENKVDFEKAAFSLLKLANVRNRNISKSEMNGPLSFIQGTSTASRSNNEVHSTAFRRFLCTILNLPSSNYPEIVQFLTMTYANLTQEMFPILRAQLLDLVGIGLWESMPQRHRVLVLARSNAFRRRWILHLEKCERNSEGSGSEKLYSFLPKLLNRFLSVLKECGASNAPSKEINHEGSYCDDGGDFDMDNEINQESKMGLIYTTMQLLIDLLSNTSTRRYLRPYLLSINLTTKCKLSTLNSISNSRNNLFHQLVRTMQQYETFAIEDISAAPLSDEEMSSRYHERAHILQKMCHRYYPDALSHIVYGNVGMICNEAFLRKGLQRILDVEILVDLCHRLRLVDRDVVEEEYKCSTEDDGDGNNSVKLTAVEKRNFVLEVLVYHHTLRPSESKILSELPLYPDERLLWNPHLVPIGNRRLALAQENILALPKMGMQFLTYTDYLLRCFKLLRLESAYEIRSDLVDVIRRMRPALRHGYNDDIDDYLDEDDMWSKKRSLTEFHGWSRMGLELTEDVTCPVRLVKVSPPKLGESIPSEVVAEITLNLKHCGEKIRKEWDSIGEFDNVFLVGVDATAIDGSLAPTLTEGDEGDERRVPDEEDVMFPKRFGVVAVRGCMVLEVRDDDGNVISDPSYAPSEKKSGDATGDKHKRHFKVALDPAQYAADATGKGSSFGTKVYQTMNVIVRRHGKENNFKAVLETVRSLMKGAGSVDRSIPRWLQPILLGYDDPSAASFLSTNMKKFSEKTTGVTPLDAALDYGDTFISERHLRNSFEDSTVIVDGIKEESATVKKQRMKYRVKVGSHNGANVVTATSYSFPPNVAGNPVHFTPVQVKAIRSGLSPGLTMIVGPPGTGKTDVAVQIIANLYHSFPSQRTVLVTHSNAALNDLFEKVMARGDIDERYMLRLGAGERDLQTQTEFDFTKTGRVNHILARRLALLEEVQLMSESLGISGASERGPDGSPSYTCETAAYFNLHHIEKRIQIYKGQAEKNEESSVGYIFPFDKYFNLSDSDLSSLTALDAESMFRKLTACFEELAEYRPLELLRTQRQRIDYLLTKQVKIVAMTCTHAAIARSHLVELGFQYDNIIMEEAGQMLDIETFVPLLLQSGEIDSSSRLKRICLIGDHHQLPPVIKNAAFSNYSNFDQSLFTRLIRLGVPIVQLDRQGRSRPGIANLFTWRYSNLGNLDHVSAQGQFSWANPGFLFTHQLINVDDYEGRGESAPTPYYYQNAGEAEYAVAIFQYMVAIGYPPEKISILTTYNGQKGLLEDILSQRCGDGTPLAGIRPGAVSTVDKYQGQQNDYIILSLVRTKSVGHLRDIRRLIVAVSRARLGIYILCRENLFRKCHELNPVMKQFSNIPSELHLVTGEFYSTKRSVNAKVSLEDSVIVNDVTVLGSIVHDMQKQMIT